MAYARAGDIPVRWDFPPALVEAISHTEPGTTLAEGPVARAALEARTIVSMLGVTDGVDTPAGLVEAPEPPASWPNVTRRVESFLEQVVPA
ncbi:MAG: hypothetical protein EXR66_04105 [Dehalococcoidia bacterium]|nr:hypothetical protein [Dehalococcoidia bacterium]